MLFDIISYVGAGILGGFVGWYGADFIYKKVKNQALRKEYTSFKEGNIEYWGEKIDQNFMDRKLRVQKEFGKLPKHTFNHIKRVVFKKEEKLNSAADVFPIEGVVNFYPVRGYYEIEHAAIHEVGHVFGWKLYEEELKKFSWRKMMNFSEVPLDWVEIKNSEPPVYTGSFLKDDKGEFVKDSNGNRVNYSEKNIREDFAESFMIYFKDPARMRENYPKRFRYLEEKLAA